MVAENFKLAEVPMPEIEDGQILLKTLMISCDPYMRGRMDTGKSYFFEPFQIDGPIFGGLMSVVVSSKNPEFAAGDTVSHFGAWQKFSKSDGAGLNKCDTSQIPVEAYMSSVGYSGLSSYLPIVHIGEPKEGDVAYVNAAAGAVGSMACQILKQMGCKVVGSAGSAEKVAYLEKIGVDAFNYKEGSLEEQLKAKCPDGIDIFFENVGGQHLEVVLDNMNNHGRIIACGMISQYDLPHEKRYGVKNLFQVVSKRLKMQGFIMGDYSPAQMGMAVVALTKMVTNGEVQTEETILDGFEKAPEGFLGLFKGANIGKMLVRVGTVG